MPNQRSTTSSLVFGEKNDPFGFADMWRTHFPHARSHVIEGGNHFPMCDEPEAVATRMCEWLDRQVERGVSAGSIMASGAEWNDE